MPRRLGEDNKKIVRRLGEYEEKNGRRLRKDLENMGIRVGGCREREGWEKIRKMSVGRSSGECCEETV